MLGFYCSFIIRQLNFASETFRFVGSDSYPALYEKLFRNAYLLFAQAVNQTCHTEYLDFLLVYIPSLAHHAFITPCNPQ